VYNLLEKVKKLEKSRLGKYFFNFVIFLLLIYLTFYIIFKGQDINNIIDILKMANVKYILFGVLSMFAFLSLEAINIGRMLKNFGEKSSFISNLKYAFLGFFFNAITPAASGGQPMQIYVMHKDGLSIGSSTISLLMNVTCVLIVSISISIFGAINNIEQFTPTLFYLFIFGTLINSCAVALLLVAIFSKRVFNKIILFVKKIINSFYNFRIKKINKTKRLSDEKKNDKIVKLNNSNEKLDKKVDMVSEKYKANAEIIKKNKKVILITLLTYYFQYIIFFSIAFWAYRALGLNDYGFIKITLLQAVVWGTVSGIPSPGAVGISEAVYLGMLQGVIPNNLITSLMLLTRIMNFYLFVLIGIFVVLYVVHKITKMRKIANS